MDDTFSFFQLSDRARDIKYSSLVLLTRFGVIAIATKIIGGIINTILVLGAIIFTIMIAGCTGSQDVTPTQAPTLAYTSLPAQTSNQTSTAVPVLVPRALFSYNPPTGSSTWLVSFVDESMNNPTSWQWSFGDGTTSTAASPTHAFSKAGTYNVSLTVTNSAGSDTISCVVPVATAPTVTPTATPTPTPKATPTPTPLPTPTATPTPTPTPTATSTATPTPTPTATPSPTPTPTPS